MKVRSHIPAFARPAFAPTNVTYEDCGITEEQDGMTLREYAAIHIMQGMMTADVGWRGAAEQAVKAADALLEELAK